MITLLLEGVVGRLYDWGTDSEDNDLVPSYMEDTHVRSPLRVAPYLLLPNLLT